MGGRGGGVVEVVRHLPAIRIFDADATYGVLRTAYAARCTPSAVRPVQSTISSTTGSPLARTITSTRSMAASALLPSMPSASSVVIALFLPLGVLASFLIMHLQGINANIMSLGGIAIAIGAMIDAAVVMIENAHKKLEAWQHAHPGAQLIGAERWRVMTQAAEEVGPALFFSLLIITLSFVPVFALEAQEGRLFSPLAYTKTYAMAASAILAVTLLVPVATDIQHQPPDRIGRPAAVGQQLVSRFVCRIAHVLLECIEQGFQMCQRQCMRSHRLSQRVEYGLPGRVGPGEQWRGRTRTGGGAQRRLRELVEVARVAVDARPPLLGQAVLA